MTRSLATAASTVALLFTLFASTAARADWGIRAGLDAPLATHVNDGNSYNIGNSFQPALDILVQKGPDDTIAFGIEGHVNFVSTNDFKRTGSSIGPEMMINIPVLPLYVRATLPLRLEPDFTELSLRIAAGFKLSLPLIGIYAEVAADMPFVGNNLNGTADTAFSQQVISVGAGIEIHL